MNMQLSLFLCGCMVALVLTNRIEKCGTDHDCRHGEVCTNYQKGGGRARVCTPSARSDYGSHEGQCGTDLDCPEGHVCGNREKGGQGGVRVCIESHKERREDNYADPKDGYHKGDDSYDGLKQVITQLMDILRPILDSLGQFGKGRGRGGGYDGGYANDY